MTIKIQDREARENEVVKAYNKIIEEMIELHKTFDPPHLGAFALQQESYPPSPEFISRFIAISLSSNKQTIFYGKSSKATYEIGPEASTKMIRILFNATAKENTSIDIENCLDDQYFHLRSFYGALTNPEATIHRGA